MRRLEFSEKDLRMIGEEWDRVAEIRRSQIEGGLDLSFDHVLLPSIRSLSEGCNLEQVVDVGCGIGSVAAEMARDAQKVVGVDLSEESIRLAQSRFAKIKNLSFVSGSMEDFAASQHHSSFSAAVANMSLMTALNLEPFVRAISNVLRPGGCFIFTITHPCFWPSYWGYIDAPWFQYKEEIVIEAPFKISLAPGSGLTTTHIHRPLEMYVNTLESCGLSLDRMLEPVPSTEIQKAYPAPWHFPRFLAVRCVRTRNTRSR